jgi:VanZ family protein
MPVRRLLLSAKLVWPLLIAALVIAASHRPRLAAPDVTNIDKITHFAVYGLIGTLLCRAGHGWRAAIWAIVAASVFGATDEWHQSFVPGRSPEFAD